MDREKHTKVNRTKEMNRELRRLKKHGWYEVEARPMAIGLRKKYVDYKLWVEDTGTVRAGDRYVLSHIVPAENLAKFFP